MTHKAALSGNVTRQMVLVLACCIAYPAAAQTGASVLYSITTSDADAVIPTTKTQLSKTGIYAVDTESGKQRLVFSDANAPFIILPGGNRSGAIVTVGGRIFAEAVYPVESAAHTPKLVGGVPAAMYELSTDGSGQARKVYDLGSPEQRVHTGKPFFNSTGSEFANVEYVEGKWYLVVHDTETLKVLRNVYLRYGPEERLGWRYGSIENIGWMADDKRFFFTIALAGDSDDAWWTTPTSPVGTYVLNETADTAQRLAPEVVLHPKIEGMKPSNDSPAMMIAELPDGGYLLQDYEGDSSGRGGAYLYELNLANETQRIFPLPEDGNAGSFHLSRSGDRLAFVDAKKDMRMQPRPAALATLTLWVMEMGSGKQTKLISFPPYDETHNAGGPWINLIGWLDDK